MNQNRKREWYWGVDWFIDCETAYHYMDEDTLFWLNKEFHSSSGVGKP